MKRFVVLEKELGRTPLETVNAWRALHQSYKDAPLCYAGRLDPLAEGKLLVLIGDECKRQKAYANLDKEYEIAVLLGASTDTGDLMGMPELGAEPVSVDRGRLKEALRAELGTHERAYPAFSSKTVRGIPLFLHALRGTLPSSLPTHEETVHEIRMRGIEHMDAQELLAHIERTLALVTHDPDPRKELGADFRRGEIRARWRSLLSGRTASFPLIRLSVACGSGAYMRSLAERIGESLGTLGLAFSIRRTRIGRRHAAGLFSVWFPSY